MVKFQIKDDPTILSPLMTGMGYGGLQDSIRMLLYTNVFADNYIFNSFLTKNNHLAFQIILNWCSQCGITIS